MLILSGFKHYKNFFLILFLLLISGCAQSASKTISQPSLTRTSTTSSTRITKNLDDTKPNLFVLHDNHGAIPAQLAEHVITEIPQPTNISFNKTDEAM